MTISHLLAPAIILLTPQSWQELCALTVGQAGTGTSQFPWSGQQEGQQFVLERGIGNEVCVILLFFSFSYYLEYW